MLTTSGKQSSNNCEHITQWKIEMSILLIMNILNYIDYKHYVNDILSVISHNDDINSQNKINNQEHKIKLLEKELENVKN